ncbi:MAG TPA: AraC family transcriptional regulator ligand-binding domain-containing protein, partial [Polyangiaceae bacterium]|nr:AraC family transcriptional regulator ligand-binding domain-containing protein [Polyangiaceae bacterium]
MKRSDIANPSVPISYLLLTLEQGVERGLSREALLEGTGIANAQLEDPGGYVPFLRYGHVVARVLEWSGDSGLGYDFGLRAHLSTHGVPGFGLMNSRTLREAAGFGMKYFSKLRTPGFSLRCFVEGPHAVAEMHEAACFGPLRQYAFDMVLVTMTHVARQFVERSELELWFDCPEPEYYARYRDRLPPVKFATGVNQVRVPVERLERRLETANVVTQRLVVEQCEREMALLGHREPVLSRVRAALADAREGYPDLEGVASRLGMSSRTLKRRLREHGLTFRQLLDDIRRRDGIRLLQGTTLSVEDIAYHLGYTAPGNFSRAFRSWTGVSPAVYRKQ